MPLHSHDRVEAVAAFWPTAGQVGGLEGARLVGAQPFGVFDAKLKERLAKAANP